MKSREINRLVTKTINICWYVYPSKVVNHSWFTKIASGYVVSDFDWQNHRCWQDIKPFNFKYSLFEGEKMNYEFDGMYLYEYMGDSQPKYVIRGNYIHGFKKTWEPAYEILGNLIHKYLQVSQTVYEIRGKYIYKYMRAGQPIYEIKNIKE